MRVVIDTNVLISGAFFGGPPATILKASDRGKLHSIVSPEILEEHYEVWERISVRYSGIDMIRILLLIALNSQVEIEFFANRAL